MSDIEGLITGADGLCRCWWCGENDELYRRYHDEEWGNPVSDDIRLFEKMCLEGFQAGLSWITILRKRENFRAAFAGFDYRKVAKFTEADIARLLGDAGIIRHRGKIEAAINNARKAIALEEEFGSLAAYFWRYEPDGRGRPQYLDYAAARALTTSPEAMALSKDLKKRGFKFVGPTTMYALMQAMGMVNDHLEGCHARARVEEKRSGFVRPV